MLFGRKKKEEKIQTELDITNSAEIVEENKSSKETSEEVKDEVKDEVLELLMDLEASDGQLDSPFVYASARNGISSTDPNVVGTDFIPLFETILSHIPAPTGCLCPPDRGAAALPPGAGKGHLHRRESQGD